MGVFGAKSRKGNAVLDGVIIIVVLLLFGIVGVFGYMVFDNLNDDIIADSDLDSDAQEISSSFHGKYPGLIDGMFLMAFVLFTLFVVISVFLLDTHPVFFIVSVVLLISVFVVGGILSNTYDDIMSDTEISGFANNFTYTNWIMTHLVECIIAIAFFVSMALFAKYRL